VTGTGAIGPDKAADLNDNSASAATYLEYNAGGAAPGTL